MKEKEKTTNGDTVSIGNANFNNHLPQNGSIYQNIVFAFYRCKQLNRGAHSRLIQTVVKRKNTSIAFEEIRQGLITFHFEEE